MSALVGLLDSSVVAMMLLLIGRRTMRGARSAGRARLGLAIGGMGASWAILTAAAAVGWIVSRLAEQLALANVVGVVAASVVLALGLYGLAWWCAGAHRLWSGHFGLGDTLTYGDKQGRVAEAGLLHLRLEQAHQSHLIPWFRLGGVPITVTPADASVPVEVVVDLDAAPSPELLRKLELTLRLCPYRTWADGMELRPCPKSPAQVEVRLWTWSEGARRAAEAWIRKAVRDTGRDQGDVT